MRMFIALDRSRPPVDTIIDVLYPAIHLHVPKELPSSLSSGKAGDTSQTNTKPDRIPGGSHDPIGRSEKEVKHPTAEAGTPFTQKLDWDAIGNPGFPDDGSAPSSDDDDGHAKKIKNE